MSKVLAHYSMDDLYDRRLYQLREQYDVLELSWGGGHDSCYLLEVSYRNNIPYDVISMVGYGSIYNPETQNEEFRKNYAHIDRYLEKFPNTQITFLDLEVMYEIVQKKEHRERWTTCNMTLDDICGLGGDEYAGRKSGSGSCLITGRGWKKVLYNRAHGQWSMYHHDTDQFNRIAYTGVGDMVHFFDDPDIIYSSCMLSRQFYNSTQHNLGDDKAGVWAPSGTWMQLNILYRNPVLPVWRIEKITHDNNEFSHPKMGWFFKDNKPSRPETHKSYWQWVEECSNKMHIDDLGGNSIPHGYYKSKVRAVDFHKEQSKI